MLSFKLEQCHNSNMNYVIICMSTMLGFLHELCNNSNTPHSPCAALPTVCHLHGSAVSMFPGNKSSHLLQHNTCEGKLNY